MTREITRFDIRNNAEGFVEKWKSEKHEKGNSQTFYNEFFEVFGVKRFGTAVFEKYVERIGHGRGYIDLYWPKTLIAEHKSMGEDREKAMSQAQSYLLGLTQDERPQFMLACDFQNFLLVDLDAHKEYRFKLSELPERIDLFDFMRGKKPRDFSSQAQVSVKASELMGGVYDALRANGYPEQDAARLLTELTFCFFADDTGIFNTRGALLDYLENTADDGSDLGPRLVDLFAVLNMPDGGRQKNLPPELAQFPYVNGDLFAGSIATPWFDAKTRASVLEAANFNWEGVSPSIFGALFQSVMSPKERRGAGAHYTSEENILKVIGPLFIDDLRAEFEKTAARKDAGRNAALDKFRKKLAGLNFFDPACGAGNFLIIAYRELRRLELEAIRARYPPDRQIERFDSAGMPLVNVDQFYGLEINWYSAKIAETAMWMMDHLMNNEISNVYGDSYIRIPLKKKAKIVNADALETDWIKVLPSAKCSYLFGNPPFGGSKTMSVKQRAQVKKIANLGGSGGTLDYVAAWFVKAVQYASDTPFGFVAVNSITQGEQVGQLWPLLLKDGREISFAYKSFVWDSDAAGKAHVHVVVIGLAKNPGHKRLFDENSEENPRSISPYLIGFDGPTPIINETHVPLNGLSTMAIGSQPIDGGHYIFSAEEKDGFLSKEPNAAKFMRPYIGAREFINGGERWILALQDAKPSELKSMPEVMKRVEAVQVYRNKSNRLATKKLALTPTTYFLNVLPTTPFMLVPRRCSGRREYVPIGYATPPTIPSDATMIVQNATRGLFGLITSKMHVLWLDRIGGKLKGDYAYSAGLVYNTFPLPDGGTVSLKNLESFAQAVLDARAAHPGQSLAELYDPVAMPPDLRRAHEKLNKAVDRLYRKEPFNDDHERIKFLLERYDAMIQKNQKILSDKQLKERPAAGRAAKPRAKPKNQKLVPEPEHKPKKNAKKPEAKPRA